MFHHAKHLGGWPLTPRDVGSTLFAGPVYPPRQRNVTEQISKDLAHAAYGTTLIAVACVTPSGAVGFVQMIVHRIARGCPLAYSPRIADRAAV